MKIVNLCEHDSLASQYMRELRDKEIQGDRLRFRTNVKRLGQIVAYELSKCLAYETLDTETPLAVAKTRVVSEPLVLATILRAGLPFHEGMLSYLDQAENAFVSAYRQYHGHSDDFEVRIEYMASPFLDGKTLIIADPMLATGCSMELAYRALLTKGTPTHVHLACVIATDQAIDYVAKRFPEDTTVWTCDIDHELDHHSYIVPGLGDAGDLLYGAKT